MDILLIVAVLVAVVLVAAVIWRGLPHGPSLDEVGHLRTPAIVEMPPQKVLLVRAKGDPNAVGRTAFGLLMKTYFRLKGVPKGGPTFRPPRARWPVEAGLPMGEWEGHYAMPVPESVTEIPGQATKDDLAVELTEWEYGPVAQVLHVGRYDAEVSTVETLRAFVRSQGYEIHGLHEEEYLRGPGFLFPGNPDRYLTLIRYPVRRTGPATGV